MPDLKYYDGIRAAQAKPIPRGPGETPRFDFDAPTTSGLQGLISRLGSALIPFALWFFRTFWPNPRFGRLVIVTRAEDVCAVLEDSDHFEVPFRLEMTELGGGTNSVLGMEDEPHAELRSLIADVLHKDDLPRIRAHTRALAGALIRNAAGRLDVVGDLITRCATESCATYFGLEVDDPVAFADWTMAISSMLFADPFGNAEIRRRGLYGSIRLQEVVDRAIDAARQRRATTSGDSLADRFVSLQQQHPTLTDPVIRATLIGLMTGFVPTTTLAAGKMLQALLDRPAAMARAKAAACRGDFDGLKAILMEAGRLNPALDPGQWRYCRTAGMIAEGTWRQRAVPKDSVLLVAVASALRDGRMFKNPGAFRPEREQRPDLMFGFGPHWCLGKYVAMAQITEVFQALLALDDLQPAADSNGRLQSMDAFPRRLDMTFTPPPGSGQPTQSMVTVCLPLADEAKADEVARAIAAFGNPAGEVMRQALTECGVIHFASLSCLDLGEEGQPGHQLVLELNGDGTADGVLRAFAEAAPLALAKLIAAATGLDRPLLEILQDGRLDVHYAPWSVTGLQFNGTPEFAVVEIARDKALADFARRALDNYLQNHLPQGRPMAALRYVRDLIRKDWPEPKPSADPVVRDFAALAAEGVQFRPDLVFPSRRTLKIAEWVDIDRNEAFWRFLKSPDSRTLRIAAGLGWLAIAGGIFFALGGRPGWWSVPGRILSALAGGAVAEVGIAGLVVLVLTVTLRWKETHDVPDIRYPDLDALKRATAPENPAGFAQNHITATPPLKPGAFRRLTLAFGLWTIGMLVKYWFRPGFVLDMGTIHYARWYRAPNSDRLIFQSNYDGSWESYLEDFITKAHPGQTLAWSNCLGFPETRYLQYDGAQDGDHFKRWVRRQQVATQFWFSRFPDLTTDQIRNNALIRDGLARATTDTAARAWLACFGSMQRPEFTMETDEVQSVLFSGLGRLTHAAYALLRLPDDPGRTAQWLKALTDASLPETGNRPCPELAVTFGDAPAGRSALDQATLVAFSARGLQRLGLPDGADGDGLATFPAAFRMGMAQRGRVLGDVEAEAPQYWRWSDGEADGVLIVYGKTRAACDALLRRHADLLGGKSAFPHVVLTEPVDSRGINYEHFGFRDGISQPVIRGAQRFAADPPPTDVLEPGELILGYRTNQGYFPPSAVVGAETDPWNVLPTAVADTPKRFPVFAANPEAQEFHDFGRNGSYLVLRQLEQDVDGFRAFTEAAAARLNATYDLAATLRAPVDEEWVAAKLIGRWRDGAPLIDRPNRPPTSDGRSPDNDFAFGIDDPAGLRCPLGAHIRRVNPRDSFSPGDAEARTIVNRHRLLRRGRPYRVKGGRGGEERGLMFACLCADLERQFEFVQQTWVRSPNFHGLNGESDPVLGGPGGRLTIPTVTGAVEIPKVKTFVTTRAGGYFFMPGRSALVYLQRKTAARAAAAPLPDAAASRPGPQPGLSAEIRAPA